MSKSSLIYFGLFSLVLSLAPGCNRGGNPGTWDEAKVEQYMMEKMELESVDLSPSGDGFEGTGTNTYGETYELKITQQASGKRLDYEATGDRGTNETGFYSTN